jgi:DNA topoisomerase I
MNTLVIVESPGKLRQLKSILGAGYDVVASVGHVRDLPPRDVGVEAPDFVPRYEPTDRGRDVLAKLTKDVAAAGAVLLATDPDREGEAIAWHLADALHLDNPRRISFNALTEKAVKAAVSAPRPLDMALVHAQEARRVLDRLVGWRVSPALSDRVQHEHLSAGRVQSPAIRLVVEREREISAFKATEHYGVELTFSGGWKANWETKPHLEPGSEYMTDAGLAGRVAAIRTLGVAAVEDGAENVPPPEPFITTTLQQAASRRLKFRPQQTMELAQRLYEQGAITYMRTDSPNLSEDGIADIAAYAQGAGLKRAANPRVWKARANAQEAHEAIRPTHCAIAEAGENDDERALYRLIWERAVASQLSDAAYDIRTAKLTAKLDGKPLTFIARGRTLVDPGWQSIYHHEGDEVAEDDDDASESNSVPALAVGAKLTAEDGKVLTKTTRPPRRYDQASLVKALEVHGIGRPATYAAILGNILNRDYIAEDEKGGLSPAKSGYEVVDALVGTFRFVDYDYTAKLEHELDAVAGAKMQYLDVVREADGQLDDELRRLRQIETSAPAYPCPTCGKPMHRRHGKAMGEFWWGCTGYPDCKTTLPDDEGKPGERKHPPVTDFTCRDCGKPLVHWQGKGRKGPYDFFGCSGFPACHTTYHTGPDGKPMLGASRTSSREAEKPAGGRRPRRRDPRAGASAKARRSGPRKNDQAS